MTAHVRVLTTGGTIASRPDGTAVSVALSGDELVAGVAPDVEVSVTEVLRVHSFNLSVPDLLVLSRAVLGAAGSPGVAGVVVTHGTDTMEETAYLLDLLVDTDGPVVLTGAQRHAAEPDADGPRNLTDAIRVAADPDARGLGAVIVMAGRIHPARRTRKVDTVALDAFGSGHGGPIGAVTPDGVRIRSRPVRSAAFGPDELGDDLARVEIVTTYVGADGNQLAAARSAGAGGIVLDALGAGNPTPGVLREVIACTGAGVPVLVTSRCHGGPTRPVYGAGGGADLAAAGAVFAGSLDAPQARLLLAASVTAEPDPSAALRRLRTLLG